MKDILVLEHMLEIYSAIDPIRTEELTFRMKVLELLLLDIMVKDNEKFIESLHNKAV